MRKVKRLTDIEKFELFTHLNSIAKDGHIDQFAPEIIAGLPEGSPDVSRETLCVYLRQLKITHKGAAGTGKSNGPKTAARVEALEQSAHAHYLSIVELSKRVQILEQRWAEGGL